MLICCPHLGILAIRCPVYLARLQVDDAGWKITKAVAIAMNRGYGQVVVAMKREVGNLEKHAEEDYS